MDGTEYHFVATLSWNPDPRGSTAATTTAATVSTQWVDGTVTAPAGATRRELVAWAVQHAKEAVGANETAVVVFLSIERNEL